MKPEEIKLSDWQRILVGEVPGSFYIELLIRVVVVYLILIVSMRLMGKRMASQLSRTEMIAMVALAASIGIPVMTPDRGLIPGVISAAVIVTGQRLLARRTAVNGRFESLVQGDMGVLVKDSVLQLDAMKGARITRERLFSHLRSEGIYHLGSVRYVFIESDGKFTLIRESDAKPGLSVLPEWDREFVERQHKARDVSVCTNCGNSSSTRTNPPCPNCQEQNWVRAVED